LGQITIYLDKETEYKMNQIVKQKKVSKSKWIAGLIQQKTTTHWPEHLVVLAGAWRDFPTSEKIRKDLGEDSNREML
jgi:hypothetical protein